MTRGNPTPNIGPTPPAPAAFAQIAGTPADQDVPVWSATDGYASWGSSGGGSQTALQVTVPITSAELKALRATPKTLVPAPGAHKMVMPILAVTQYIPGVTPYTYAGGNGLTFGWVGSALNSASGYGITSGPPGFGVPLLDTTPTITFQGFSSKDWDNMNDLTANLVDAPLVVTMDTNEVAGGDGTLVIVLIYTIATLS